MIKRRIAKRNLSVKKTTSSGDTYYTPSPDSIQDKIKQLDEKSTSKGDFFTPKEGKNVFRVLPPYSAEGMFYHEVITHFGVGPNRRVLVCLADEEKGCPVCNLITKYSEGDSDKAKAKAKDMGARSRILMNVMDRNTGKFAVWACSEQLFHRLLSFFADPEWGDFTHPEKGFDVILNRQGTGKMDTKYEVRLSRNTTPIGVPGWSKNISKLNEIYKKKSRAEVLAIIRGEDEDRKES
jgi:hypothetical protein